MSHWATYQGQLATIPSSTEDKPISDVLWMDERLLMLVVSWSVNTPHYWSYWWMSESFGINGKGIQGASIYKAGDVAHSWWGGFHRDVCQPQGT